MVTLATLQQSEAADTPADEITSETVYSVLADKRRRYAVHYLKQQEGPTSVRELSEQVAAWENNKDISELTSKERKRVYIALYQSHLDTMDEEGIVEYDADRGDVRLSQAMSDLDLYLEAVPKGTVPWSLYYLGLSIVNGILLMLAWFDVHPFGTVPDLFWGGAVLVTFAVSAFIQSFQTRRMRFGDAGPPPEYSEPRDEG